MIRVQAVGQDRVAQAWGRALPEHREPRVSLQGSLHRREGERSDVRVCRAWEHHLQEPRRHCPVETQASQSLCHWVPRVWRRLQAAERWAGRVRQRWGTKYSWQSAVEFLRRDAMAPQKQVPLLALRPREPG